MLQDRCLTDIIILAGENGVLLQEEGETPEGFSVDKSGKVETKDLGMDGLEKRLADLLGTYEVHGAFM